MQPSPIQKIQAPFLADSAIDLWIKRDDLVHPRIIGNKWRKLQYNLIHAKQLKHTTLLTFGGAYSNHIHAVAAAGKEYGFRTIGIIRGEQVIPFNPTLQFASDQGMSLHFVTRTTYRKRNEVAYQQELQAQFGKCYVLPEGGTNQLALQGCVAIAQEITQQLTAPPDYICTSCGTGGTLAGIIRGSLPPTQVLGIAALKGDFLKKEVAHLLSDTSTTVAWSMLTNYHFGGYARFTPVLIEFINSFKQQYGLALDPIYTGKMMFGIFDLIKKGFFPNGSTVVAVHTGGLQGIAGFNQRHGGVIR